MSAMICEMTVSPQAALLRERVRAFLADPDNVRDNLYYPVQEDEREQAAELVDRGVCFYSADCDHLGVYR